MLQIIRTKIKSLYFKTREQREILLFCLVFFLSSCAHYRTVCVYNVLIPENGKKRYYAVAKNNVIIPEFSIGVNNDFPESKDVAWQRFKERKNQVESFIDQKYSIPNSFIYQTQRVSVMLGLAAVSPAVVLVSYASEVISPSDRNSPKSFKQIVREYFYLCQAEPEFNKPEIKNEFIVVPILKN